MSAEQPADLMWRPPAWLRRPEAGLTYTVFARVYALGTLTRLGLPDAMSGDWLLIVFIHLTGVASLLVNGALFGWLLCAIALVVEIGWLEDQLTQSMFLLLCACTAAVAVVASMRGSTKSLNVHLPTAVRVFTIGFYAWAGIHKINSGFLDPRISCANGGLELLVQTGRFPEQAMNVAQALAFESSMWPLVYIAIELGVVALMILRPAIGVASASVMHVPLTIVFAPSFAFVMASGWVCFFRDAELKALAKALGKRAKFIVPGGVCAWVLSQWLFFVGRFETDPDWCIKELFVWLACLWMVSSVIKPTDSTQARLFRGRAVWQQGASLRWFMVPAMLVVANGLSVYLGLQMHHTGAMLSNLRIDDDCHNSLVFPLAMRIDDPYIRIDEISFVPGRATPGSAEHIQGRLWSEAGLYRARERWCKKHPEPLAVRGSHDARTFHTKDLCAAEGWPFAEIHAVGFRRFQRNLARRCQQSCIH